MDNKNIKQRIERMLAERTASSLPIWVRAPKSGQTEFYSGLTRGKLYQVEAAGLVRTASLKPQGAVRGVKLFDLQSLLRYVESCATKPSKEE
jgi:hypothetical protein